MILGHFKKQWLLRFRTKLFTFHTHEYINLILCACTFKKLKFLIGVQQQIFGLLLKRLCSFLGFCYSFCFLCDELFNSTVFIFQLWIQFLNIQSTTRLQEVPNTTIIKIRRQLCHLFELLGELVDALCVFLCAVNADGGVEGLFFQQSDVAFQLQEPSGGVTQLELWIGRLWFHLFREPNKNIETWEPSH